MTEKPDSSKTPYGGERNTEPSTQTENINARNNNVEVGTPGPDEATVERANRTGIGDAAVNDQKLTGYTSNRSADA